MKKFCTLAIALLLIFLLLPGNAQAAEVVDSGKYGDNLTWTLTDDGTLTISGTGEMYNYYVISMGATTLPIDDRRPWKDLPVTTVVIEAGVTSIGQHAFYGMKSITSVTISESATQIGEAAFSGCVGLTSISIPESVRYIGEAAFSGCTGLTSITISDGVKTISPRAFYNCTGLTSVTIPNSVTSLSGFGGCTGLTGITIPDSVTTIGDSAFYDCDGLTGITIPDSVTTIGDSAFYDCDGLTEITIPASVIRIDKSAFSYCSKLEKVTFLGNCPDIEDFDYLPFSGVTATCYYPLGDSTWDYSTTQDYDGDLTWVGYCPGHVEEVIPAVASTCSDTGLTEGKKCSICGEVLAAQLPVAMLPHTEEVVPAVAATCTATGLTEGKKCSVCGATVLAQAETPALGHTEVVDPGVAATCIAEGITEGKHCGVCNAVLIAQEVIPAGGHTEVIDPAVESGCTTVGATEGSHCSVCNTVLVPQEAVPETGHNWFAGECIICGIQKDQENKPLRIAGAHRYETAFLVADQMKTVLGVAKFDAVVVASGTNFADALSGSYLAVTKNAPILLACNVEWVNDLVKDYIRENLNPGGKIYILGGEAAVPASFTEGLEGFEPQRLAGASRFDTNLMILEEAGVGNKPILVSTGIGFADSLSASASGQPILLVWNNLTDGQKAFLETVRGRNIYILGGTGAVSQEMEEQLAKYGKVFRLAGSGRFETSVEIAKASFASPTSVVLAYAWDFPDGLCGGPLAAMMNAPLLLTMEKYESAAAVYVEEWGIGTGLILGGEKQIPDSSISKIFP